MEKPNSTANKLRINTRIIHRQCQWIPVIGPGALKSSAKEAAAVKDPIIAQSIIHEA